MVKIYYYNMFSKEISVDDEYGVPSQDMRRWVSLGDYQKLEAEMKELRQQIKDPADDGWIQWGGCAKSPVDSTTLIQVRFRDGSVHLSPAIHHYEWRHFDKWFDIMAYRLVK